MQIGLLDPFHRRIRRAFQGSPRDFLGYDTKRQIAWGYESRRTAGDYYWDGMKRGLSSRESRVLFQYTLSGWGEYAEGKKMWAVEPGRGFTVILPSAHRYYLPESSNEWSFFWFIVQHPMVTERIRQLRKETVAVQSWQPGSPALETAATLFEGACRGQWRDVWAMEEVLFSWLLETERELHRRRFPQDERQRWLEETRRGVLGRLTRPPGMDELAAGQKMERTTFSRKFKAATGLAPAAYVLNIRLEEALKLLRTPAKLDEVARQTGFADANHFCKVFRRHFHSSPGAYRKLILKK